MLMCVLAPLSAAAQDAVGDERPENIEELSLVDLLNISITTASKRKEQLSESASIANVITRQEIEEFHMFSLEERLSMLPGVEVMESYYGFASVTFRGVLQTHYNNKSLLLLNGNPIYAPTIGSHFLAQVPQEAIEQMEVLSGPGSTLYGTNGYAGVINVVTRRPEEEGFEADAYLTGGSFFTSQAGFAAMASKGELDVYLFGVNNESRGYPFVVKEDEEGTKGQPASIEDVDAYEDDYSSFYGGVGYEGLTLNAGYFSQKKDKWGIIPTNVSTGAKYYDGWLADLTYRRDVHPNHALSATLRTNWFEETSIVAWYPPVSFAPGSPTRLHFKTSKSGGELQYNGSFFDDMLLVVGGVSGDRLETKPYKFFYMSDVTDATSGEVLFEAGDERTEASAISKAQSLLDLAAYVNVDFSPTEWLTLNGGLRDNYDSDYGIFIAPRGGVVFGLPEGMYVKALYGRAFRAPSFFEKHVSTANVLFGGDTNYTLDGQRVKNTIGPEVIDTVDVAWALSREGYMARVGGFYLSTDELIGRTGVVPADSSLGNTVDTPLYANGDGYAITGVEVDLKARPVENAHVFWNGTYRQALIDDKEPPLSFAPILMNVGGSYTFRDRVRLGAIGQYVGSRTVQLNETEDRPAKDVTLDPYFPLNASVALLANKNVDVEFALKNITDVEYAYPENIRRNVAEVPGGPGRSFYATLKLRN